MLSTVKRKKSRWGVILSCLTLISLISWAGQTRSLHVHVHWPLLEKEKPKTLSTLISSPILNLYSWILHLHIWHWVASRSGPSPPGPASPVSPPAPADHPLWWERETRSQAPCYCKPWCPEIRHRDSLPVHLTEAHTSDWQSQTLLQLWCCSRLSTESAISFTLRLLNSGLSWAALPSSVVQTGVKSRGWENRTPQLMEETCFIHGVTISDISVL